MFKLLREQEKPTGVLNVKKKWKQGSAGLSIFRDSKYVIALKEERKIKGINIYQIVL